MRSAVAALMPSSSRASEPVGARQMPGQHQRAAHQRHAVAPRNSRRARGASMTRADGSRSQRCRLREAGIEQQVGTAASRR